MLRTSVLSAKDACTKCGEETVHPDHRYNKNLGYCQGCANLLELGQHKDYLTLLETEMDQEGLES